MALAVRYLHPAALLMLPHRHHRGMFHFQWLTARAAAHIQKIRDHSSVSAGLYADFAEGKFADFDLLQSGQHLSTIQIFAIDLRGIRAAETLLDFAPVLVFDVLPPEAFELLGAGGVRPGGRLLRPNGATADQSQARLANNRRLLECLP